MLTQKSINNSPIGVAIAGLGFGESVHLPALKTNRLFNPIALWHPREERLSEVCKKNQINGFSNFSKLLADKNIDAIVLATPPAVRFELALQSLNAGNHLLLEKPVGLNARQVKDLHLLAMDKNLIVAVDFEYRAVPLFMQAKRIIDNGLIGKTWLVKLDWLMSSRANPKRPWNWYSKREEGGGVIGALGTHAFDIIHWLCGPTQSINGLISTAINQRPCLETGLSKKVTSEDIALATLELTQSLDNSRVPAQVNLSAVAINGRGCWLEIYGSKGSLLLGSDNQKDYVHGFGLWFAETGQKFNSVSPDKDLIFPKTWSDGRIAPVARLQGWWAESIKTGKPMIPGLLEGLNSQIVCDKLIESNQSKSKLIL